MMLCWARHFNINSVTSILRGIQTAPDHLIRKGKGGLRVAILEVAWESVIVSRSYRVLGLIDFAPTDIIFSHVTLELLPSRRVFLPNKNKTSSNFYVSNLHRIKDRP